MFLLAFFFLSSLCLSECWRALMEHSTRPVQGLFSSPAFSTIITNGFSSLYMLAKSGYLPPPSLAFLPRFHFSLFALLLCLRISDTLPCFVNQTNPCTGPEVRTELELGSENEAVELCLKMLPIPGTDKVEKVRICYHMAQHVEGCGPSLFVSLRLQLLLLLLLLFL